MSKIKHKIQKCTHPLLVIIVSLYAAAKKNTQLKI